MKQNAIASEYVKKEMEKEGMQNSRDLRWLLRLFIGQSRTSEEYNALVSVRDYPNYILHGKSLNIIFNGLLINDYIRNQIIDFYKNQYTRFRSELLNKKYYSEKPIWIVIQAKELEANMVYPLIISDDNYKRYIVLAINVIE